ncbi:MAG: hypothetical protein CMJ23_12650 [Phycisphaerae bacterium]|nr:hypothetical protein [Phycisphaerae bacterium]
MGGSELPNNENAEIRDLALREVLNLLDETESARLESAFDRMTPDQQAEILDLQAAVAREIASAGSEVPDRSLRYRVLARVAAAIEEDTESIAPLATIGDRRRTAPSSDLFRSHDADPEEIFEGSEDAIAHRHSASGRGVRGRIVWRAAALVLGSCLMALGVIHNETRSELAKYERFALREILVDQLEMIAEDDLDIRRMLESSTAEAQALSGPGGAALVLFETVGSSAGRGSLVVMGLSPSVKNLELLAVDPNSGIEEIVHSGPASTIPGGLSAVAIDLGDRMVPGTILVLKDADTGREILRSSLSVA